MELRVFAASHAQRTRWKNDGGWTTELARSDDESATDFRWRVSIAEIESDGPFSHFAGVERDLLLLEGNGIELDIDDAGPLRLTRRFAHARFQGESTVGCRLLAGATRDFNVMARRDAVRAEVVARPLVGPMVIFPETGAEWFVHVFAGHALARSGDQRAALATGDSLYADYRVAGGTRIVIEGGGEVVLVKFAKPAAVWAPARFALPMRSRICAPTRRNGACEESARSAERRPRNAGVAVVAARRSHPAAASISPRSARIDA
jgi:uncharacterized protein